MLMQSKKLPLLFVSTLKYRVQRRLIDNVYTKWYSNIYSLIIDRLSLIGHKVRLKVLGSNVTAKETAVNSRSQTALCKLYKYTQISRFT